MTVPERLLGDGEELVAHLHPHWKTLVLPIALVPVVIGVAAFGVAAAPDGSLQAATRWAVVGVALILLLAFSFLPWLRWRTTHLILTTSRIITRSGILSRSGRDIPLARVNDVTFSHTLVERLLRCGTLVVESGGERGQLVLTDVPRVEAVQRDLADLVDDTLEARPIAPGQRRPDDRDGDDATDPDAALTGE
jgi:uncharacterized membrane protein YdbT with pleckstrin-like domain